LTDEESFFNQEVRDFQESQAEGQSAFSDNMAPSDRYLFKITQPELSAVFPYDLTQEFKVSNIKRSELTRANYDLLALTDLSAQWRAVETSFMPPENADPSKATGANFLCLIRDAFFAGSSSVGMAERNAQISQIKKREFSDKSPQGFTLFRRKNQANP